MKKSEKESELLFIYNQLSNSGKEKLIERAQELQKLGYTPNGKKEILKRVK